MYYSISEVADMLCMSTNNVRKYCNEMGITLKRNKRGVRSFTESDMDRIRLVKRMMDSGMFNLKGIKQYVDLHGWRTAKIINKQIFNEI